MKRQTSYVSVDLGINWLLLLSYLATYLWSETIFLFLGGSLFFSDTIMADKSKQHAGDAMHYPFWFGGSASCIAACFTHPLGEFREFDSPPPPLFPSILRFVHGSLSRGFVLDLVKVRMQTAVTMVGGVKPTMLITLVRVARGEGMSFWGD